ncbi:HdeD family acid-resistance protein [Actinomadura logoneensis]|uniref:HdeD family acid-resistance protein n=1 Tax=Actinomadura logoneensis TaxID=2293572 RepID=A0A372JMI5_9ACTN|nr:HdeD family acid-resistance protein [Actinomadura logoneensis]RFU40994.1 HdeD family acid-resistance protein [Actinomadura logoneensis]
MIGQLSRHWWVLLARGVFAVLFGVLALFWPGITVWALTVLFGAYALVDGVFALVGAFAGVEGESRGWLAVAGVCGILLGLMTFAWPAATALVLLLLIASWAVIVGVLEIVAAVRLRRLVDDAWLLAVAGVVSVLFGLVLFIWPASGAIAVAWLIGLFAIVMGAALIGAAFRLRKLGGHPRTHRVGGQLS